MKTQLISAFSLGLLSVMAVNTAFAQKPKEKLLPQVTITSDNAMVSQRVLDNFEGFFNGATNVRWAQINKRYLVKFDYKNMNHNALYMQRGYRVYDVGYGYEKDLPSDIRKMVSSVYQDHDITRVFEVKQNMRHVWIINLQNEEKFVTARIEDGEMREVTKINGDGTLARYFSINQIFQMNPIFSMNLRK